MRLNRFATATVPANGTRQPARGNRRMPTSCQVTWQRMLPLFARLIGLALILIAFTPTVHAQCAGCSNQIPVGLQINDCRENEDGSAPVGVVTAGGPGGTNVEIRHANLFNGGMTVTHVCVRLQSPTGQPAEPGRVTLYTTDPNNFDLPGNAFYQENFVISPSLTNYQLVALSTPQNVSANFWVAVEYPTARATIPHQYVSDRHVRNSALFIDAPGLGWIYYDDTMAAPYIGKSPMIRALNLGPIQNQACCFPDGSCSDISAIDCTNLGGVPQGPGTNCMNVNCPIAQLNDTCGAAAALTCPTTIQASTVGAQPSNPPACGASGSAGLWYEIVGSDQTVNIDTCGSTEEMHLALYIGSCGNLNCLSSAATNQLGVCPIPDDASLSFFGFNGISYYLFVSPENQHGDFTLNMTCGPANDDCANAEPIVPGLLTLDNCSASTDGPAEPCGFTGIPNDDHDLWYTFDMPCDGTYLVEIPPAFETLLGVYSGCPTAGGVLVGCDGPPAGAPAIVSGVGVAGEQLWVRVGGRSGQCGTIDLSLTIACNCPWDIATPAGAGQDGSVDVFDLLQILAGWNTGGPGATIAPPLNNVDVFDLLEVLGHWGPCP